MKTQNEKDWNLMIKKEMDLIKREDKQENVERIAKAQQFKKDKILEKIEFDNMKTQHVRKEKEKLLETRFQVRREADKQKTQIMEAFEMMKKKGKIDSASLQMLGLTVEIKEDPNENDEQKADMAIVRKRQNKDMKKMLEQESQAEQKRDAVIAAANTEDEKHALIKENDKAKAISSDKISNLQVTHEQEVKTLQQN